MIADARVALGLDDIRAGTLRARPTPYVEPIRRHLTDLPRWLAELDT